MASVHPRKNKAGTVTSYQVRWRLGGSRSAPVQTESFDDEPSAVIFRDAVNDNAQQWPTGWVKGRGYITALNDPEAAEESLRCMFRAYATNSVRQRTGAEDRYKESSLKELETYVFPTFGNCDVRSTEHFSKTTVSQWLLQMQKTMVYRGARHKPMSPKTIKNLHGLLSSILKEATQEEPPLRTRNPCELSSLPRTDDDGAEDDEGEDVEFLEPAEVDGIVQCLPRPEDKRLVRTLYATGLRWGEVTALARRHIVRTDASKPKLRVTRAWRRSAEKGYYLGKPKTKRSRRTLRISPSSLEDFTDQGAFTHGSAALIFDNGAGLRLPYSTFYDRWVTAVKQAKDLGLLPDYKFPTIHDLRHSHAAALISRGHPLTYVQRRLGHESIQTTSDRYGHLLPEADDDAMTTIDATLRGGRPPGSEDFEAEVAPAAERRVHVVHFGDRAGAHIEGFWKREDAVLVAEQWGQDNQQPSRIETWAQDWWVRQHGNGLKDVRSDIAGRLRIFWLGPATYQADGSRLRTAADRADAEVRWAWEWEDLYTGRPAASHIRYRPGPDRLTEAEAWGTDQEAVREAYTEACARALAVCGNHPGLEHGQSQKHELT